MMKGAVIMRYISHYEEYPIYEPAEGGYYYPGNQLVASERKSKRQCRKDFEKIWQECLEENKDDPEYPWHFDREHNYIYKGSYYIGEGESFAIERNQGSMEHGYEPYC